MTDMQQPGYAAAPRRGLSSGTIAGIVILVLAVGAAAYFFSDVWRTKANEQYKEMTQWTPANIAKDPVNYLNFCEEQTNKALEELKRDRISVEINKANLQRMKDESTNKVRVGEQQLVQLVGNYKVAEQSNTWPVSFGGRPLDKEGVKNQVVSLDKQVKTQKNLLTKVESGLTKLNAQVSKIDKAQAEAQSQLAEIAANRELLKVQQVSQDLQDRLVKMQGAIAGVVATAGETGGTVSLDQLVAESATAADNAAFEKVLTEVKTN